MKNYLSLGALALGAACATEKPLYTWGSYQTVIYNSYQNSASPNSAIGLLEKDAANFSLSQKGAPPGYHAQLGFLYHQMNNASEARKHFEMEKRLFPESKQLMDRLLNPALNRKTKTATKEGQKS